MNQNAEFSLQQQTTNDSWKRIPNSNSLLDHGKNNPILITSSLFKKSVNSEIRAVPPRMYHRSSDRSSIPNFYDRDLPVRADTILICVMYSSSCCMIYHGRVSWVGYVLVYRSCTISQHGRSGFFNRLSTVDHDLSDLSWSIWSARRVKMFENVLRYVSMFLFRCLAPARTVDGSCKHPTDFWCACWLLVADDDHWLTINAPCMCIDYWLIIEYWLLSTGPLWILLKRPTDPPTKKMSPNNMPTDGSTN